MTDSLVLDVPMELGLELMTVVRPDLLYTERKLLDDVVDKIDCVGLSVPLVDFQSPHARGVINRGVLVSLDLLPVFSFEYQELRINRRAHNERLARAKAGRQTICRARSDEPLHCTEEMRILVSFLPDLEPHEKGRPS